MLRNHRSKLLLTSAAALVLSIASTAAIASAMSPDDEDENDYKNAACTLIGCPNGNRLCGTAGVKIKAGVPPFVGEVGVEYTCYESRMF